jgi:hypothetical protein
MGYTFSSVSYKVSNILATDTIRDYTNIKNQNMCDITVKKHTKIKL